MIVDMICNMVASLAVGMINMVVDMYMVVSLVIGMVNMMLNMYVVICLVNITVLQ